MSQFANLIVPQAVADELESNSINFNCLSALTDGIDKYTYFIINFIKFIMNQENFANDFVNSVKSRRNDIISSSQIQMHPRYYEMYSWLSVMWQYIKEFMDYYSVELSFDYEAALIEHIISQDEKFNIDPIKLFARTFFELKEANRFIVTDYNGMKESVKYDVMETSDELFLKSGDVYNKITDHLNENSITFPYTEVTLRQKLYEMGLLDKRNNKSLTTEKKIVTTKVLLV